MKAIVIALPLAGCATPAPPAPTPCPDLPELAKSATLADLEAHYLAVVRLDGMCRAAKNPPKLEN